MYNKERLNKKIKAMFDDLRTESAKIIREGNDFSRASEGIAARVSSETLTRSKSLITDMYKEMSEHTLESKEFREDEQKIKFYEANIRGDLLDKYKFDVNSLETKIEYKEASKLFISLAASAGTMTVSGVLKYVLASKLNIPFAVIIAGAVAVFCITYFKGMPDRNKKAFAKAIEEFLNETEHTFAEWFDEIEIYYNKKVNELISTF